MSDSAKRPRRPGGAARSGSHPAPRATGRRAGARGRGGRSGQRARRAGGGAASGISARASRALARLRRWLGIGPGGARHAWRHRLAAGLGLALGAALVVALVSLAIQAQRPHATGPGFHAGRIIEDREFYDGGAMDAAEVQAFLDRRQPSCTPAGTCLRDHIEDFPGYEGTERCDRIDPIPVATAAQIIAAVGRACDLSQRALLVLLEKEQSLVSNVEPEDHRYDRATGYFCPDDPARPGWCDPEFGGFSNQLYYAAAQFQRYRLEPQKFTYREGEMAEIPYAPNAPECGAAQVFIENDATAGLYNYTPYTPNAAALDPATPEGDACSAFGNRNFWLIYGTWFGGYEKPVVEPAPQPSAG